MGRHLPAIEILSGPALAIAILLRGVRSVSGTLNNDHDPYRKFRAANFPQTDLAAYVPTDGVEVKFLDG